MKKYGKQIVFVLAAGLLLFAVLFAHSARHHKGNDIDNNRKTAQVEEPTEPMGQTGEGMAETAEPTTATEPATLSEEERMALIEEMMQSLPAGTVIPGSELDKDLISSYFLSEEIPDDVFARINGKSYVENPNVALSDLRYLKLIHYNFNHEVQVGELIVWADLAEEYLSIFRELYDEGYEIEKMHLIDDYWSDEVDNADDADTASCDDNNTSCFCYRAQTNATKLSYHAYGKAIDINPQMNPYVTYKNGKAIWYHENSNDYIDRSQVKPHMINEDDICYQIFTAHGFAWGGAWKTIKDYQHFQF